jgi:hypothetical protein
MPQAKNPDPPKEEKPSREQGVQHIDDDKNEEFDARTHASAEPVNPEGEEEVYAGGLSPEALEVAEQIDKEFPRRSQLLGLRDLIDGLIGRTGQVPEQPQVPLVQSAANLPPVLDEDGNEDRSGGMDHAAAAKAADLEPDQLVDYAVRQDRTPLGEPVGPKVLRYVRADGTKNAVALDK